MKLDSKDIEFLVAISAHEESFLYEIYAAISQLLQEAPKEDIVCAVLNVMYDSSISGMFRLGQRSLGHNEVNEGALPCRQVLEDPSNWDWPASAGATANWYIELTDCAVPERGLHAVSADRARELMFGSNA